MSCLLLQRHLPPLNLFLVIAVAILSNWNNLLSDAFVPSPTAHAPRSTWRNARAPSLLTSCSTTMPAGRVQVKALPDLGSFEWIAHAGGAVKEVAEVSGPLDALLHSPTLWSIAVMLSIVGLLLSWETSVHTVKTTLPSSLVPVVDSMLAEMGGIGFVGLFLSIVVTGGPLGHLVGEVSEKFLGEEEILLETFEFLHTAFFEVGIGFFVVSGIIVWAVLGRIQQIEAISSLAFDDDGDGEVTLEELADGLGVQSLIVDADGDGVLTEDEIVDALRRSTDAASSSFFDSDEDIAAECLLLRERLLLRSDLPPAFLVEQYFDQVFGHNLEEVVELSPVTWLPLIPLIALENSVDLSHEVVSASSSNAAVSCGFFYDTPWVFYPSVALQVVSLTWAAVNFWKMAKIKTMLVPTLVKDGGADGEAVLLPPKLHYEELRKDFDSSPSFLRPIESWLGREATNDHEGLFGAAGANGPAMYRNSIKFQIWLCVAQIVFYGTQIVLRDAAAVLKGIEVGDPNGIYPELGFYSFFVALSIGQLALAPSTFLKYVINTSVEDLTKNWAIEAVMNDLCIIPDDTKKGEPLYQANPEASLSGNY